MENKKLQIALYDGCQYFCTFCMYEHAKDKNPLSKKNIMTDEDWYKLFASAYESGYRTLNIAGRGEPTLHPSFGRIIARAYKLGFRISLLTNGLNDPVVIKVLPLLQNIRINFSALNEHEMQAIHKPLPGFSFDRCIASIKNILRAIEDKQYDIVLYANYVLTTQSMAGAFTFPERVNSFFSSELKTRKMVVSYWHFIDYVKNKSDDLALSYEELQEFLSTARAHSHEKFLLENTDLLKFIDQTEDLLRKIEPFAKSKGDAHQRSGQTQYTCEAHKTVMTVDGNGDCYGCYSPFRTVNGLSAKEDPFFFGNVRSQESKEILRDRKGFNPMMDVSNKYWKPCLTCVAKGPVKE